MSRAGRSFPELLHSTHRFTASTRGRLERALVHALQGRRHAPLMSLRDSVGDATNELRAVGLTDQAVLDALGALVEDTGRACGADRPSLISGELRWVPVRAQVLQFASAALGVV